MANGLTQWTPFSSLRRQMELRVLRITFLSNFNLSRSFDFGRYITIAEENNIIEMLEVSPAQWAVFLGILVSVCVGFTLDEDDHYNEFLGRMCSDIDKNDRNRRFNEVSTPLVILKLCLYHMFHV